MKGQRNRVTVFLTGHAPGQVAPPEQGIVVLHVSAIFDVMNITDFSAKSHFIYLTNSDIIRELILPCGKTKI